jgi:creatinine amidohydrolase
MRRFLSLLFVIAAALPVEAAAPGSVFLEALTWTEARDAIANGHVIVLVPIGGTEQNGPHIAIGKHNARARELARRIAERLGNTLVAPVVAYVPEGAIDPPTGHMRYAGTISIPADAFERTLEATARSLLRHGFRHVVFLGDHGGYRKSLDRVAAKLRGVHALPEYYREMEHAGLDDTALTLAIDPALVRIEVLKVARPGTQGIQGDPRGATAARGAELAQGIVERTAAAIGKATATR